MATQKSIAEYIENQVRDAGSVHIKKMFGEYALYYEAKVVGLICDDQLFIKPTLAGKEFLGEVELAAPYPGAKDHYLIPEDRWDDAMWLKELILVSAPEIALPKKKKK